MSKGIKKVANVAIRSLLGVVLALILLILVVGLAFSLPRVQSFAAAKAVEWLSDKVDVRMSIDALYISGLSHLAVDGLMIEDLEGDTLLYASTASATIDRKALFAERVVRPSDVRGDGVSLRIVSDGPDSNADKLFKHIVSLLPINPDKQSAPLVITDITLTNSRFRLYQPNKYAPQRTGMNYADMDVAIERAVSPRLVIEDGVVDIALEDMHFADKSGAVVKNGRIGMLTVGAKEITFDDIYFESMGAVVDMPRLAFDFEEWADWDKFNSRVKMFLKAEQATLTPEGLMAYVPDFFDIGTTLTNFSGTYDGLLNDFWIDARADFAATSSIDVSGRVVGIEDIKNCLFEVDNLKLNTNSTDAMQVYGAVSNKPLRGEVARWVGKLESVGVELSGSGSMNRQEFDAMVATDKGSVAAEGVLQLLTKGRVVFNGDVDLEDVELGKLLEVEQLGTLTGGAKGEVLVGGDYLDVQGRVDVASVKYGGYEYHDISVDGGYVADVLKATLTSGDPNMALTLEAECDMSWLVPSYSFVLGVERADFAAVGLSGANPVSTLSCSIEATGEGANLDELEARAMVNNLLYYSKADTLSTELINIVANNGAEGHSLSLYSSLADVEYRSKASYGDVIDYFGKTLPAKLPLVGGGSAEQTTDESGEGGSARSLAMTDDLSTMLLNIKTDENLLSVFVPGASVAPDSSLRLEFSPSADLFELQLDCGYFEMNDLFATDIMVDGSGGGNRIDLRAEADQLLTMGTTLPQVVVSASCVDARKVGAVASFDNSDNKIGARLKVDGTIGRSDSGSVVAEASVDESWLAIHDQRWNIGAQRLYYVDDYAVIEDFAILSELRRLYIDGEIGSRNDQSLRVELYDVPVGEIVGLLTNTEGIECRADGQMVLSAATSNPFGSGRIDLSDISFGDIDVDPLYINVGKVQAADVVSFGLVNSVNRSSLASVSYDLKDKEFDSSITIREVDLSLADALLGDVVSGLAGKAAIDLDLVGGGERKLTIDGSVGVEQLTATVGYTGVTYESAPFEVKFVSNRGELGGVALRDKKGGTALLDGFVDFSGREVSYGLHLMPNNLMVIDLTADAQSPFYGNVYASGAVSLDSEGNATNITAALSTGDGSVFSLPLQGNNDFAGADFVQFVSAADQAEQENDIVAARKSQFEGRNRKAPTPKNTNIDAQLRVGTNTELRLIVDQATDNVLVARGEADMNITLDSRKEGIEIRGDYQIAEGVYNFNFQNIISKQFDINQGSYIRWNGSPLDATLDVAATYKLKTSLAPLLGNEVGSARSSTPVECIVNLGGRLSAIDLSFDINVPTANAEYQSILSSYFSSQEMMATQFVYLLALGSFYSDSSSSTQGASPTAAGTAIGLDFLANQVSKLMSNDSYKFKLKYNAIDDTSSSYGVDFQTEIIEDRLLLELEANVDTGTYYQSINPDQSQLSGGGSLTLLLDKAGDFILKSFSRTIDRFDENQGLQENGVGLYYRRSFDKFSDLWRKKPKKAESNSEKSTTFAE